MFNVKEEESDDGFPCQKAEETVCSSIAQRTPRNESENDRRHDKSAKFQTAKCSHFFITKAMPIELAMLDFERSLAFFLFVPDHSKISNFAWFVYTRNTDENPKEF